MDHSPARATHGPAPDRRYGADDRPGDAGEGLHDASAGAFDRYHRQMLLPGFGREGQARLRAATVLVAGCGALGASIADSLARAGVGRLILVDRDVVELTNLQRQTLYDQSQAEAGLPKAVAAAQRLGAVNPEVRLEPAVCDLTASTADRLAEGVDLIADGLDNFETRYLLNDLAVRRGIPLVYGGAVATSGMCLPILPHPRRRAGEGGAVRWSPEASTPCLRCLFPDAPPPGTSPTCDTVGVLGPLVSMVAALQATLILKLLTGQVDRIDRRLVSFDLLDNEWRFLDVSTAGPGEHCPCCGEGRFEHLSGARGGGATSLCGRSAVQVTPPGPLTTFDLAAAAERLRPHGRFERTRFMVRGAFDQERTASGGRVTLSLFPDGRAILHGIDDRERARALYAKYVGV